MTLNPRTEEYYKKFIELQENLRKSEEERLKLEMKFNEMVHTTKEQTQMHYRKLRAQYKRFLDEDRKRQDRNEAILRNLARIETRLSMITAKTDRFQLLRQQYRAMLDRIYQTKLDQSHQISHEYRQKQQKTDMFERYLKNMSSAQVGDLLGSDRITKQFSDCDRNDDLSSFVDDGVEYRPNCANSLADDILQKIDKNRDQLDDRNNNARVMINDPTEIGRQSEQNTEIPIGKLPGNSTGSETDDESSDKLADNELGKFEMDNLPKLQQFQEKPEALNVVEQQNQHNEHNDESLLGNSDPVIDEFDTLPTEKINIQENNEPTQPNPTETNENNEKCDPILEKIPEANQQNIIENEEAPEFSTTEPQSDGNMPEEKEELNLRHDASPIKNQNDKDAAECSSINDQKMDNQEICEPQSCDKDENGYSLRNVATIETDTKDDPAVHNPIPELQNDTTAQFYAEYPNSEPQYDENGQLVPQYDEHGQLLPQYDANGQFIPQYDQNGLLMPQYDGNGQLVAQYDQNGQLIPQFDQNGQLIPQYDQNGQSIPQYDQYGQVIPQYDGNGQMIPQYDENGQLIPQYDEHGQPIAQYYSNTDQEYGDNNQFENYPDAEQYDTKPKSADDADILEDTGSNGKPTEIMEEAINKVEDHEEIKVDENNESVDEEVMAKSKPKVLEMLDTDTESIKQETKISNDSDFDFSNS